MYSVSRIYPTDKTGIAKVKQLLENEGIRKDANLDYTCAVFDDDMNVIATGSCFGNTLRCLAVSSAYQGEGLMNLIITHLIEIQYARNTTHIFLYTKCKSAKFFSDLGFYEIERIENHIVFMENKRTGFADYLAELSQCRRDSGTSAAIVMNANPFTLGHQFLVEKAAQENDTVHLFMVSEDKSLVPYSVRKKLIQKGVAHLPNVVCHDSGPYIISNATFPSYFQKDETAVIESHALLDLTIFCRIAKTLNITRRYVGEEPASVSTGLYNRIMTEKLPQNGIDCIVIPRKTTGGEIISASTVRQAIKNKNWAELEKMVPKTTADYFASKEAQPVIQAIQNEENVVHY